MKIEKEQVLNYIFVNNILNSLGFGVSKEGRANIIEYSHGNQTFLEGKGNILIEPDLENIVAYPQVKTYFPEKNNEEIEAMFKIELAKIAEITQILNLPNVTQEQNILFELNEKGVKGKIFDFTLGGIDKLKNFNDFDFSFANPYFTVERSDKGFSLKEKYFNKHDLEVKVRESLFNSLNEYCEKENFPLDEKTFLNITEKVKSSDYMKEVSEIKRELFNAGANRGIRLAEDFNKLIQDFVGVVKSKISLSYTQEPETGEFSKEEPKIEENLANLIVNKFFIEQNINSNTQKTSISSNWFNFSNWLNIGNFGRKAEETIVNLTTPAAAPEKEPLPPKLNGISR